MFDEEHSSDEARRAAVELFRRAYEAQQASAYGEAIELYRRSIETYPTAEAHTFLGWVYSFQQRYDEAIDACLAAIRVDPTFGNPYNDIGSYLIAKGDLYNCVRWFKRALEAPRYESYAFPHFNLGRVYEQRGHLLRAARHYGLALQQAPDFTQATKALRRLQARLN
ncbi:MAG TPA: tetratricopeptide repeat protein [Pyrinomonadaceae bacterium]|jgi:tetratricopeptide (TPR) repeat protein